MNPLSPCIPWRGLTSATLLLIGITLMSPSTYAAQSSNVQTPKSNAVINKAHTYRLADNDTIQVPLSGLDVNRLKVTGDVITAVHCPAGWCIIGKQPSNDGSTFLSINTAQEGQGLEPFTFFVDTEQGRHFGVLAIPKAIPAITALFDLKENRQQAAMRRANSEPYITELTQLMKQVILRSESGQPLGGFDRYPVKTQTFEEKRLDAHAKIIYEGARHNVVVYEVRNQSAKTQPLYPSQWYVEGLEAQAILPDVPSLPPGGRATLYQIVTNTGTLSDFDDGDDRL
ncbi:type-F conjugative transfer system secretin TraK [Vibrio mediterranei]